GALEIMYCTERQGDILTVTRGQENTGPFSFGAGDRVELRLTAAVIREVLNSPETLVNSAKQELVQMIQQLEGSVYTSAQIDQIVDVLEGQIVASSFSLPPGFGPVPWSRAIAPTGWIFCDGRVLMPATPYSALRTAYI